MKNIHFQYQCPGYVTTKIAKIRKANFFVPTPSQYVRRAINSIGLQQSTSVWLPQRAISPILQLSKFVIPETMDDLFCWLLKSFYMFAMKREMEKSRGINPGKDLLVV
jgi:hypothetical protein